MRVIGFPKSDGPGGEVDVGSMTLIRPFGAPSPAGRREDGIGRRLVGLRRETVLIMPKAGKAWGEESSPSRHSRMLEQMWTIVR